MTAASNPTTYFPTASSLRSSLTMSNLADRILNLSSGSFFTEPLTLKHDSHNIEQSKIQRCLSDASNLNQCGIEMSLPSSISNGQSQMQLG
ncbi:unnamed protein product, partial [Didymodactylos carnosus]